MHTSLSWLITVRFMMAWWLGWHLTQCRRHGSKQISKAFPSDPWLKSLENLHSKIFRWANTSLSHILKMEKSFQGADFWEARWLAHLQVWLEDTICHQGPAGIIPRQSSLRSPHMPLPTPRGKSIRGIWRLSWQQKFIPVHRHTNQILQEQRVKG